MNTSDATSIRPCGLTSGTLLASSVSARMAERPAGHQHPQHVIAALARLAQAREPLPCPAISFVE
jgi:hypothetical protein